MSAAGNLQWFRVARLVVGKGGAGVDLSNLRIWFEIVKTVEPIPNTATIKVYNLKAANVSAIQEEYTDVILHAGYAGSVQKIFQGNIQFVSHYRESADFITEITAGDGDQDYRNAYMNDTLAAGTDDAEVVRRAVATMSKTSEGVVQTVSTKRSRGKVLRGPTRDVLTQIARSNGANWSIQDGELQMVRADAQLGVAVILNADTGLLEAPERNDKGISVKCLLNPSIAINSAIQLENTSIRIKRAKQRPLKQDQPQVDPVRLNPQGIYKVLKVTHQGDTRAPEWYTLAECIGLGQPIPTARTSPGGYGAVPYSGNVWE